jgi:predicted nucleotidyltransferase
MFQQLLKRIAIELTKNNIPYMVIGGQAVLIYGEPRLTKDIDITLGIGCEKLEKVRLIVEKLRLKVLVDNIEDFAKQTMVFPAMDDKSGIRIDFILSFSFYEKQAIERAKKIKLANYFIKFASLEDLIIHKIIANRGRDIEDIKSILLKNSHYDRKYIIKWLNKFDNSLNGNFLKIFKKIVKEL